MSQEKFNEICDLIVAYRESETISEIDKRDEIYSLTKEMVNLSGHKFSKYLSGYVKHVQRNNREVSYYLYTFTLKPNADHEGAHNYILGIANRIDNLELHEVAYVIEHEDTNKHYHVMIGSYRCIRSDAFKHYASKYGFVHRSKKISKNNIQIQDYMTKENIPQFIVKDGKKI